MKAFDESSQTVLDGAETVLCMTETQRQLLQTVYDLGLKDGQIMQLRGQLANKEPA